MLTQEIVKVRSFDGQKLNVSIYKGDSKKIKGVVQITHGMCEHSGNHTSLIKYLVSKSYIVAIYDHRGHGKYNGAVPNFSYMSRDHHFNLMVKDLRMVNEYLKDRFKDKKLFLLGYSMGGFLSLKYSQVYGDTIDGLILVGIGREEEIKSMGSLMLVKLISLFRKPDYLSKFVRTQVDNKINRRARTYKGNVNTISYKRFIDDKYRVRTYTLKFYHDLLDGIYKTLQKESFKTVCKDLKVFIIGGDSDAICSFGKGIIRLDKEFKLNEVESSYKIYPGISHNLFIENRREVNEDIVKFLNSQVGLITI